ncbi:type VI secretion system baseplate subunit TssF [Pelotalea chapellei]|uniref:Type VI secretion system baseplate subunit TssF n=1 Tax=Pelotalea chapellei TaxID=44671 RepID=A0ABS5U618_9BACT|nr:type VI secretion system baseplate subunit TssF [Pelotalea chapellei]
MNQIEGIVDLQIKPSDRLSERTMLRGWGIKIKLERETFSSFGEMFLFGALLDRFLRGLATQSCFIRAIVEDVQSAKAYEWPAKMGKKPLL